MLSGDLVPQSFCVGVLSTILNELSGIHIVAYTEVICKPLHKLFDLVLMVYGPVYLVHEKWSL